MHVSIEFVVWVKKRSRKRNDMRLVWRPKLFFLLIPWMCCIFLRSVTFQHISRWSRIHQIKPRLLSSREQLNEIINGPSRKLTSYKSLANRSDRLHRLNDRLHISKWAHALVDGANRQRNASPLVISSKSIACVFRHEETPWQIEEKQLEERTKTFLEKQWKIGHCVSKKSSSRNVAN